MLNELSKQLAEALRQAVASLPRSQSNLDGFETQILPAIGAVGAVGAMDVDDEDEDECAGTIETDVSSCRYVTVSAW